MKAVEYAISAGEGTLIRHGFTEHYPSLRKLQQMALRSGNTMIFARASADCQTGR